MMNTTNTSSGHGSAEGSDTVSESSTIEFDHEPFSTFQPKVLSFVQEQIWPDAAQQDISVERMEGGSFNRVIGLRLTKGGREASEAGPDDIVEYILRIPRFNATQVDRDVAALQFVRRYTTIPVPVVISFDELKSNKLGCPYMIQGRLYGTNLLDSYQALSHAAKCAVAEQLGDAYNQMLAIESSTAGVLVLTNGDKRLDGDIHVAPFGANEDDASSIKYDTSTATSSARLLMVDAFRKAKVGRPSPSGKETFWDILQGCLCTVAVEMEEQGILHPGNYSLAHLDFAPHNILLKVEDGATSPCTITGILDWDSAILGPKFMSCAPPMWLWAWNDGDDEDERLANDVPVSAELRQIKYVFEKAAGQDYLRYAYKPAYRLARRLFRFAIHGIQYSQEMKEAEELVEEWQVVGKATETADYRKTNGLT